MNDQYKAAYKQSYAWWDSKGTDIPQGTYTMINEKFKAWEQRRGFRNDEDDTPNPENPEPVQKLKGMALRGKLALESKRRVLAAEATKERIKQAKKDGKKGLKKSESPTNFAPPIVGKRYHSDNNAKRAIKHFIEVHYLTIPEDYVFGVNKIDWGVYEITGSRKQTKQPSKKNENSN